MKRNKIVKVGLFLLAAITIGISPALAQASIISDLGLASDDELTGALNKAGEKGGNEYLDESRRLVKLAEEAFSEADYDKSAMLADEAANLADMAAQLIKSPESPSISPSNALPATYTVRPWSVSKDCFWNIAGFPWVYGNPHQWRLLYNANKSKLPNPDNPNILEPGTVLDIPSIKGEVRKGAWESGIVYEPLK